MWLSLGLNRFSFAADLGRAVQAWETAQGKGDSPKAKSAWDDQYASGQWEYLGRFEEISRYAVLVGYMQAFKGAGAILDVGCGDGVLFDRFAGFEFTRYVGFDISDAAISRLQSRNSATTTFLQADADSYVPAEKFDLIVFNESLYYLRDPAGSIQRYARALEQNATILISTYTASRRSLAILRDVKRFFSIVAESKTTQGDRAWICTVLKPSWNSA